MSTVEKPDTAVQAKRWPPGGRPDPGRESRDRPDHRPRRGHERCKGRGARDPRAARAARLGGARLRGARRCHVRAAPLDRAEPRPADRRWSSPRTARPARTRCWPSSSTSATHSASGRSVREKYLADERVRPHSPLLLGKKVVVRHRPYGVVGVIGPWNYPLTLGFGDAIPALMAGNSVVIKPSEVTPLATMMIAEALLECGMPEDVMPVATGRGETGAALIDHVDMVMFTGSTATGKKVMARAAERLIPVSLELGGKDPMIVLADANLERAANMAVQWAMSNSGQICMSVERVYVEEPVYDEFVSKVVDQGATPAPGSARRAGRRRGGCGDLPAAGRDRRAAHPRRGRQGRRGADRRKAEGRQRPLLRADRPDERRSHDGDHDRGDVRPDASDHEGARRRRGGESSPTTAATGSTRVSSRGTSRRARRSPAGSMPATPASTTRS